MYCAEGENVFMFLVTVSDSLHDPTWSIDIFRSIGAEDFQQDTHRFNWVASRRSPAPTYDLGSATCSRSSITSKQGSSTYTPCLNKKQAKFKLPPNLIVFGTKMANSPKLYEVHSFSTSPNSRQCTTVLNAHVQNWYITL